ncbi:MAG: hypothetical protein WCO30_00620 [bacterium]
MSKNAAAILRELQREAKSLPIDEGTKNVTAIWPIDNIIKMTDPGVMLSRDQEDSLRTLFGNCHLFSEDMSPKERQLNQLIVATWINSCQN